MALSTAPHSRLEFVRGVPFNQALLNELIYALPKDARGRPFFREPDFAEATFEPGIAFGGVSFGARTSFQGAVFGDGTSFKDADFATGTTFQKAHFGNLVSFERATFGPRVFFLGATFGDDAIFKGAEFGNETNFYNATFGKRPIFEAATFGISVTFEGASFGADVNFFKADFGGRATFSRVWAVGPFSLDSVTFGDRAQLGPLVVGGPLVLDRASFGSRPLIRASADTLTCVDLKLADGGSFELRWADVILDGSDFTRRTLFASASSFGEDESRLERIIRHGSASRTEKFRVLSLRDCDLREVVLSAADLRRCRFSGARSLEALQLESSTELPSSPRGFLKVGLAFPPMWRWTKRSVIREEQEWRARQAKGSGWLPREAGEANSLVPSPEADRRTAAEIADLYRALRSGREAKKDEPGARDFYYGEMEMRRKSAPPLSVERFLLWLYWLTSGYALRAGRAFACLLVVLGLFAALFELHGFSGSAAFASTTPCAQSPADARGTEGSGGLGRIANALWSRDGWIYSAATATSVVASPEACLTDSGRLFRIILRLSGPALLGLWILALRSRVRR